MQIGYTRVSTGAQTLHLQEDALNKVGCEQLYRDVASGTKAERLGLADAMDHLRTGDRLVVSRLDRLGRSLRHLIDTPTDLDERGIGFRSLTENIATTTPGGQLIFHIFGSLAEFERDLIGERTNAGLAAARSRGRTGGRPPATAFRNPDALAMAKDLYHNTKTPIADICRQFNISRPTLYRYVGAKRSAVVPEQSKA